MLFDLHSHTHFSDGSLSPASLIYAAELSGVTHLAITDHDNDLASKSIAQAIPSEKVTLIAGIEFSTRWESTDIHVLALNYCPDEQSLRGVIHKQNEARRERNERILYKLAKAGVMHSFEQALEEVSQIGRVHIADNLVATGYAKNRPQAFKKYLGRSGKAYVKSDWVCLEELVEATHAAGGSAVLAHPLKYRLTGSKVAKMIADFAAIGGDALEVISGRQCSSDTTVMADLAHKHQLAASLGSDFHSPDQPWCALGSAGFLPNRCRPIWDDWSP